jgi:hypothetical protein
VRDLRERRVPVGPEEVAEFETDVLAGFVLARASAGLADGTISSDIGHLEQMRTWFGKPVVGHGTRRCRRLVRSGSAQRREGHPVG